MAEVVETLLNKKLETGWNRRDEVDNFLEDKELSVTITLAEYRRLVTSDALAECRVNKAEEDKWSRENENKNLKKKIEELESIIKMINGSCNNKEGEEE